MNEKTKFWLVVLLLIVIFIIGLWGLSQTEYLTRLVMCDLPGACGVV